MRYKLCKEPIRREMREEDGYSYIYELCCREADEVAAFRLPLYSIRIILTDPEGARREANARDIFSSREKAERFFDKIVRNLATPIDLMYVLEDEIS